MNSMFMSKQTMSYNECIVCLRSQFNQRKKEKLLNLLNLCYCVLISNYILIDDLTRIESKEAVDVDYHGCSLGLERRVYTIRKHAHELENFHHKPLSATYSKQSVGLYFNFTN